MNGYREVANALVTIQKLAEIRTQQEIGVEALTDAADLSRARYDSGLASYIEILTADQDLFTRQLLLAQTQGAELRARTELYRTLGGGWQTHRDGNGKRKGTRHKAQGKRHKAKGRRQQGPAAGIPGGPPESRGDGRPSRHTPFDIAPRNPLNCHHLAASAGWRAGGTSSASQYDVDACASTFQFTSERTP